MGTPTAKGRFWLLVVSWATCVISVGYAASYAFRPSTINASLFGNLNIDHWVWAALQVGLAILIVVGQARGGLGMRAIHAVGSIVQAMYLAMWLFSMVLLQVGFFVWEGVLLAVVVHATLSRVTWPTREQVARGPT